MSELLIFHDYFNCGEVFPFLSNAGGRERGDGKEREVGVSSFVWFINPKLIVVTEYFVVSVSNIKELFSNCL